MTKYTRDDYYMARKLVEDLLVTAEKEGTAIELVGDYEVSCTVGIHTVFKFDGEVFSKSDTIANVMAIIVRHYS